MYIKATILAACLALMSACSIITHEAFHGTEPPSIGEVVELEMMKRSPGVEFRRNSAKDVLPFYSVGCFRDGFSLPGLKSTEITKVHEMKLVIVNEFLTDPAPIGVTKQYWKTVDRFCTIYNRLVYAKLVSGLEAKVGH